MARILKRRSKKVGAAPGTLVHVGEQKAEQVRLMLIDYDAGNYQEKQIDDVADCGGFKDTDTVSWLNVDGLHEVGIIESIGKQFGIHDLVLEDILNTHQRPKVDDCEGYIYVVIRMYKSDQASEGDNGSEQVSFLLGSHFVISFQEMIGDIFDPVRDRIKNTKWRIRKLGADYLLYALIDCIVDHYFVFLEKMGDTIESLQEEVASDPTEDTLRQIHKLKREMMMFRKAVWPVRDLANALVHSESSLIKDETKVYLRDVYDHVAQVIDTAETYREMISGMLDVYLSSISNKMNMVMKVLTIIATIFIPLTFIAGIYGMNFDHMPELHWKWSYPALWGVMITIFVIMVCYFKKKKWL
ncbi:MAG: magnesium/cobalt transporter CorA [Sedimentisphaerales bacterium]|nr:magnesium/cobalt transporter CorA [Sedimentisphaerales bacterium]